MKVSIIIPVYNEASYVDEVVAAVQAAPLCAGISGREIVLIDDGSADGSAERLERYRGQPGFLLLRTEANQGKGSAVRLGLAHASGEVIVLQDADLEYDPRDYAALLAPIARGEARVVVGARSALFAPALDL